MWITLTGFMASGKSTVARHLAEMTGRRSVSLDALAVERAGRSIARIFAENGEEEFRALETDLVAELDPGADLIVDAGGGLVESALAVATIRSRGPVVWLDASWETVLRQLQAAPYGQRPLATQLDEGRLHDLYRRRLRLYAGAADYRLRVDGQRPEDVARTADQRCRQWFNHSRESAQ